MCGRYTYFPKEFADLRIRWNLDPDLPLLQPRYNIAPSHEAPVIVSAEGGHLAHEVSKFLISLLEPNLVDNLIRRELAWPKG